MTVVFKELGNYGRLGNCFFQIAATIGTAKKYGDNYRFPYQPWFDHIGLAHTWGAGGPISRHIPTWNEPHFHYAEIPDLRGKVSMNLHGYFQSENYFAHCRDEVLKGLMPKYEFKHPGYVAVHVRRTDYLKHKDCYVNLHENGYYDKALLRLAEMEGFTGDEKYLVFSDDIEWCKKNFKGNNFEYSEERDPVKDLAHMIGCDHVIIANSSFSWWGAWLSYWSTPFEKRKDKTIIAPTKWFGPKLAPTHNTKDLIPHYWSQPW